MEPITILDNICYITYFKLIAQQLDLDMNFDSVYNSAINGDISAKKELFDFISVRFGVIANLKIWNKQDAEDIVQDTMLTISKEMNNTVIHTSFLAWAYKVFDNRILGYLGRKKTAKIRENGEPLPDNQHQSFPEGIDLDLKEKLFKCFRKVRNENVRYARVIALHYQGYTSEEICKKLNINTKNLYMILSRARAMLKSCVDTDEA